MCESYGAIRDGSLSLGPYLGNQFFLEIGLRARFEEPRPPVLLACFLVLAAEATIDFVGAKLTLNLTSSAIPNDEHFPPMFASRIFWALPVERGAE